MLVKRDWGLYLLAGISLFLVSCKIVGEKANPPTPIDFTGKYVFYNYGERMEIGKLPDQTYIGTESHNIFNGTYSGWTIYTQITGNQIHWSKSPSMETTVPNGTFSIVGKRLSQNMGEVWVQDAGEKVDNPELWNAIIVYSKDSYAEAEIGFKNYLKTDPNDLYAHCCLVDCLIQQGKVDEARRELANIENNPNSKTDTLNQWLVPREKYCFEGKEKSLTGQNAWDGYREAQKLFHFPDHLPPNIFDDVQMVDMGRRTLGPKKKKV